MKKILVKYPTRQRPDLFLKTLEQYIIFADDIDNITFLVSYDSDDTSMTEEILSKVMNFPAKIMLKSGISKSKIDACNRDLTPELISEHDILLLISDDMHAQVHGWDNIIREDFKKYFPNGDGCLWYHDGSEQKRISTLSCMGMTYLVRLGNIYHPSYKSFYCDEEYTIVAMKANKMIFIDNVIVKHFHPAFGNAPNDDLYKVNDKHWNYDKANFNNRKSKNFPA